MNRNQIRKKILECVQDKDYIPLTSKGLERGLSLTTAHKKKYERALKQLLEEQKICLEKGKILFCKSNIAEIKGTFFLHPRGFGFVQPVEGSLIVENIFIPKDYILEAITDDTVLVELNQEKSPKGYEGKVLKILKRKTKVLIGTVAFIGKKEIELFCPVLGKKKTVIMKKGNKEYKKGDRLEVKVLSWGSKTKPILTTFSKNLGTILDPSIDIPIAIKEYGIFDHFTKKTLDSAAKYGTSVKKEDLKERKDCSKLKTITIDPDTAKDFDDALSLTIDQKNHFHLAVHIADVSHYVGIKSSLDEEAYKRGNSTYFPGKCVPMIPETLSNGLCSLKPNVIRLSASVFMEFDPEGNLLDYKIQKAFIKSNKRFTYKEALSILEKKTKSPYFSLLNDLKTLALLLKKKRVERGSIDFALPEGFIHLDKKGDPQSIERIEYDITHQLVEEFMLKANEVVATHLQHQIGKALFRIHEKPDAENFEGFFDLASRLGFTLSKRPKIEDIQEIFYQAKGSTFLPLLSLQFIKSLKLAIYSPDNCGHFGLSLEHYCHFTSPIRRYSDLVIHRLLFHKQYEGNLDKIAINCSEAERKSMRAESSVILLKKLRLLKKHYKKDKNQIYSAIITKIMPMRVIFELEDFFLEGSCHVSEIGGDYYEFIQDKLRGSRTGRILGFGDKIQVLIQEVDLIFLQAKWKLKN